MNINNNYHWVCFWALFCICISPISGCNKSGGYIAYVCTGGERGGIEVRLRELGIVLQEPQAPVATYVNAVTSGHMVYLAGHGPRHENNTWVTGKLGRDMTIEEGYAAARSTGISLLSSLKGEIGDLDRVKRIVKVLGMVNSADTFYEQPAVMNGFSDLMVEVFGEKGKHARSAVGMAS